QLALQADKQENKSPATFRNVPAGGEAGRTAPRAGPAARPASAASAAGRNAALPRDPGQPGTAAATEGREKSTSTSRRSGKSRGPWRPHPASARRPVARPAPPETAGPRPGESPESP